jgi:hypothetical protein
VQSNLSVFAVYIAATVILLVSWALRPIRMAAKVPSRLIGWLTVQWLFSWFCGLFVWIVTLFVSGSAIFPALWVYLIVFSFGLAALASALLLVVGEAIRTARAAMRL